MTVGAPNQQQIHGYQGGHGLLYGTAKLSREDQDLVDRLSDIAGPLRPSETFEPYLNFYPLPSETYYVVARTWQDLDTPRAGCVLTRSVFIPMDEWESSASLLEFLCGLERPSRQPSQKLASRSPLPRELPPVRDTRVTELVEALFLESRRPIVVFDAPEAETIALRIMTALWPSRRKNFSSCTWCLSPRRLRGRDFDLVFAPSDARSRFSDWGGRRIEAKGKSTEARHRWTAGLVETVFGDGLPSLVSWDELGILRGDQAGDEGALRLSLMWRELESKAKSTPNAVLGMLDILNSHSVRPTTARDLLEPLVANAVTLALADQSPDASWRFYINLLGKFADRLPSKATLRELRNASAHLAADAPESAVSMLRDLDEQGRDLPAVLAAGVGDGLAKGRLCSPDALMPNAVGRRELLNLIAYSKPFAVSLAAGVKDCPDLWAGAAISALEVPDGDLVKRARRNLLPVLDAPQHAVLLAPLLDNASPNEFPAIVRTIAKATDFAIEEFDRPIVGAARTELAVKKLREAILAAPESTAADRLLGSTLRLDPHDAHWLLGNVPDDRARSVLAGLVDSADDGAVQTFMRDRPVGRSVLAQLLEEPHDHAWRVARLLRWGHVEADEFVEVGLQIHGYLSGAEQHRLGMEILRRALAELPSSGRQDVASMLAALAGQIDASDLVVLLTQPQASQDRLRANLAALAACPEFVRQKAASRVDQLTTRLIARGTSTFDESAYVQWAELIQFSHHISNQSHLNASIEALSYALKQTRWPLSALVLVTFPTVYRQLLASKGESDFDFIPALLMLPLTFFSDWDRAKTARRELVDAFISSSWPPANLILTAMDAQIDQKVLRRVSRNRGGEHYIDNILADASRLQPRLASSVRDAVTRFKENLRLEDWD